MFWVMAVFINNLRWHTRCTTNQKKSCSKVANSTGKLRIDLTMIFLVQEFFFLLDFKFLWYGQFCTEIQIFSYVSRLRPSHPPPRLRPWTPHGLGLRIFASLVSAKIKVRKILFPICFNKKKLFCLKVAKISGKMCIALNF